MPKKKGILGRLVDRLDKKLEQKAKKRKCCCCGDKEEKCSSR